MITLTMSRAIPRRQAQGRAHAAGVQAEATRAASRLAAAAPAIPPIDAAKACISVGDMPFGDRSTAMAAPTATVHDRSKEPGGECPGESAQRRPAAWRRPAQRQTPPCRRAAVCRARQAAGQFLPLAMMSGGTYGGANANQTNATAGAASKPARRDPGQRPGPVLGILRRDDLAEADADRDEVVVVSPRRRGRRSVTRARPPSGSGRLGTVASRSPRMRAPSSRTIQPACARSAIVVGRLADGGQRMQLWQRGRRVQVVVHGGQEALAMLGHGRVQRAGIGQRRGQRLQLLGQPAGVAQAGGGQRTTPRARPRRTSSRGGSGARRGSGGWRRRARSASRSRTSTRLPSDLLIFSSA